MFELAIAFIAGLVVAVIFPPIFRFVAAKVAAVRAWATSKE